MEGLLVCVVPLSQKCDLRRFCSKPQTSDSAVSMALTQALFSFVMQVVIRNWIVWPLEIKVHLEDIPTVATV